MHAGQKPPGAFAGMGDLQTGQIFVFTQIPDGRGVRRYGKCFGIDDSWVSPCGRNPAEVPTQG